MRALTWWLAAGGLVLLPLAAAPAPRTAKMTLMALGDNRAADIEALTHRYDLMIASAQVAPEALAAFRRKNPGALVFCYVNTSDVNRDWARDAYYGRIWNDSNPNEEWFHHDAAGERVRIYYPKYRQRHAFNTGSPGLQRYLARLVVETLRTGRYDGIQLDNVSTEFPFGAHLVGKWTSAVPVALTPAQWTADEVALLKAIMGAVADAGLRDKRIIFNHMRSGEPEESRAYVRVTDGANCESWMSQRTDLEGRWGWRAKVEQVREVNRLGKLTNLLCVPSAPSEEEALFCFASYLMAKEGDRAFFFYGPAYKVAAQRHWYPFYDTDLGDPTGPVQERDGGFLRVFQRGCVVVNPSGKGIEVSLPGRLRTPDGQEVTRVSLPPKRAAVLLRGDRRLGIRDQDRRGLPGPAHHDPARQLSS